MHAAMRRNGRPSQRIEMVILPDFDLPRQRDGGRSWSRQSLAEERSGVHPGAISRSSRTCNLCIGRPLRILMR
jgi:hypothetical protein